MSSRLLRLAKETAEMRRELVQATEFGDPITVTLAGNELAAVVYALAVTFISEWVAEENGQRKLMNMISEASTTILTTDAMPAMEEALNRILRETGEQDAA